MKNPEKDWLNGLGILRGKLNNLIQQRNYARTKVKEEKEKLREAKENLSDSLTARKILQQAAELVQVSAHKKISSVVTRCLRTVFGPQAYEFRIKFEQKRGKTGARLLFVRNGLEIDPRTAAGGGVLDVASFALRLSCLVLAKPYKRRLLVVDEPFKMLDSDKVPIVRELLLTLAKEMKIQIVMVTHNEELKCGKVIEV